MTMILLGRKRAKKRRNPHFSTRRKWCEKWLGEPSDDATASFRNSGRERSETAKMMMTANLWCWGRKKYRQAMLCASQVAFVEDNLTNQKSLLGTWLFTGIYEFLLLCVVWNIFHLRYLTILTWKYFRLEEKKESFTKTLVPFVKRDFCFHIDAAVANGYFDRIDKTWPFPIIFRIVHDRR